MNLQKPIVALFDFDGVVMDTESQYTLHWNRQAEKYGLGIENFGRIIKGQTLIQIFKNYFSDVPELHERITSELIAFQQTMHFEYIPGVKDFIRQIREQGVRTAIVTSSDLDKMNIVCRSHPELPLMVDEILTAERFSNSKPHPECFLLGAKTFDAPISNCIVFEDSFHGLEAGNRAGMKVVGLATTNAAEEIQDKSHCVIPDFVGFTYEKMLAVLE
jgi:HAD superfamily hydrolase (TIGR01509 family)